MKEPTSRSVRVICGNLTETLTALDLNPIIEDNWYEDILYPALRDYWLNKLGLEDDPIRR